MRYGLIGNPLGHSHSPYLHSRFGVEGYELCVLQPDELAEFFRKREFAAVNVTIPYKRDVFALVDEIDDCARECGAINTVVNRNGKLSGYNTDIFGMSFALRAAGIELAGKKVVVLGSGGTSHTACALAAREGAKSVRVVSRTGEFNYSNLNLVADAQVLFNTTPVGMFPNIEGCPVDPADFPELEGVFDAVYNPLDTVFVQKAEAAGVKHASGLLMLTAQAAQAVDLFLGKAFAPCPPDSDAGRRIIGVCNDLREKLTDVVLCGMPSSGKSTVGKLLAEMLNKKFVDTDAEVEKAAGKSIPDIFAESGEAGFRALEKQAVTKCAAMQGVVIATGGGAILDPTNALALKANGFGVFLERDLSALSTEGRPLSQTNALDEMYRRRLPAYLAFADVTATNDGTPQKTAEFIKEKYYESFGNQRA